MRLQTFLTSALGDLDVPTFLTPYNEAQTHNETRVGGSSAGLDEWQMIKAAIPAGNRTTMSGSPAP